MCDHINRCTQWTSKRGCFAQKQNKWLRAGLDSGGLHAMNLIHSGERRNSQLVELYSLFLKCSSKYFHRLSKKKKLSIAFQDNLSTFSYHFPNLAKNKKTVHKCTIFLTGTWFSSVCLYGSYIEVLQRLHRCFGQ